MKKFLVVLPVYMTLTTTAQAIKIPAQGTIVYEHVVKMEGAFKGPDGEPLERVPKQVTERFELLFSGTQSLWQPLPDAGEEAAAIAGNNAMDLMRPARFGGGADVVYQNFETGTRITQSELRAKTYLVEDSITSLKWNITGESKEILGYNTKKAMATRYGTRTIMGMENGVLKPQEQPDTSVIAAWFATELPVPTGPELNNGLPGLILELDENSGRRVYKAVSVSLKPAGIKVPKRGKRISAPAFRTEQQKWRAEIEQQMKQGGRISMPLGN